MAIRLRLRDACTSSAAADADPFRDGRSSRVWHGELMVMDIRDYLPPSLKHVLVHTSQAEREKRQQAARDAFGHPTPVPPASEPGASTEQGDADEPTLKVQPASPRSAGAKGGVDKSALPSALVPPVTVSAKPARAMERVIPLHWVVRATVGAVVVSAAVVVWKIREPEPRGVSATPTASAMGATPTAASERKRCAERDDGDERDGDGHSERDGDGRSERDERQEARSAP